jgi:hypothetical protein
MNRIAEFEIEKLTLKHGSHSSPDEGHCLLEVVSMFAGEDFGDSPKCVDPVLAAFGRGWNDGMRTDEERGQLKQYITRLTGTAASSEVSIKRSWMAFDWLVRVHLVAFLSLSPSLTAHAEVLRNLPAIECSAHVDVAIVHIKAAGAAAWAAARAALEPTVKNLQASAHDLFSRMIDVKE